jgi:pyruvate kinase
VIQGGELKSKKGVNYLIQNITSAMTEKILLMHFAIGQNVDWIALSFVKTPQDLKDLQDLIAEHAEYKKIPLLPKSKCQNLENIDKIVAYCDALMVARGDLGVELPAHEVPLVQELIRKAKWLEFQLL